MRKTARTGSFYAQLRLADVAGLQPWLPRDGMLYFAGEDQEELHKHRVIHSTAPASSLQTVRLPGRRHVREQRRVPRLQGCRHAPPLSVPSLYNARDRLTGRDAVLAGTSRTTTSCRRPTGALQEELGKSADCHLVNAHVFTQHESPEEQASAERGGLPGEWINLLMLESDNRPGFCFWDAGTLSFSIHMKDLALGDFSRTFASLESS